MIDRLLETLQTKLNSRRVADPDTLRRLTKRYASKPAAAPQESPLDYIQRIALPGGKPYNLAQHNDLIAIAADDARIIIIRKAAQKGVTELMIRLQFWLASQGYNAAYFLRSRAYMRLLVQSRVEPVIAANKELLDALMPAEEDEEPDRKVPRKYRLADNVTLKRLYGATLLYMGLQSEADVRSFPLDAVFVDEVETLKPELADALQERLYHSALKWERWFSQPTAVGYGIDERYQLTDQRHQLFTCDSCRAEFALEESFPHCLGHIDERGVAIPLDRHSPSPFTERGQGGEVDSPLPRMGEGSGVRATYLCPRCHKPFNPLSARWQWVAKYPSRSSDAHGYHLTQLYSHTMTPDEVARLYRLALTSPNRIERFYNSVLGLPYAGGDTQPIHPDKLAYHNHPLAPINPDAPRYAGVDVGDTLSLVIIELGEQGAWYVMAIEELQGPSKWDDLRQILQNLRVQSVGVNAMPYKDSAKKLLRDLNPHIGGAIIYDASDDAKPSTGQEDAEFGDPVPRITYPRTELMDATVSALLSHTIYLPPRHRRETERLLKHLQNYIVERDAQGNRRYARGREDHLGRALDYALLVARSDARYIPPAALTPENLYLPVPLDPRIL